MQERNEPAVTDRYRSDGGVDAFLAHAVQEPNEMRERLLSFIAHEMRNPLASGLWATEMLSRKASDPARVERLGKLALRSISRLRSLFEDFVALERLPGDPPPGRIDLGEAIARALAPHELEPSGIEAAVEQEPGLTTPLDPTTFDKLLHACARRMVHASDSGEPLTIRVQQLDAEPEALVSFERQGVDARVVDPPLLTPGGSEGEGTTFALLLARVAAQRLGVALWMENTPGGCVLRLRVPLENPVG